MNIGWNESCYRIQKKSFFGFYLIESIVQRFGRFCTGLLFRGLFQALNHLDLTSITDITRITQSHSTRNFQVKVQSGFYE